MHWPEIELDSPRWFSGTFTELRKANISFVASVCLSVRMEKLGFHWTGFHEILRLVFFKNLSIKFKSN
jgi:hypothetical protein